MVSLGRNNYNIISSLEEIVMEGRVSKLNSPILLAIAGVILLPFLLLGINTYSKILSIFTSNPFSLAAGAIVIIFILAILKRLRII